MAVFRDIATAVGMDGMCMGRTSLGRMHTGRARRASARGKLPNSDSPFLFSYLTPMIYAFHKPFGLHATYCFWYWLCALVSDHKMKMIMKHAMKMMGALVLVSMLFMVSCDKDTDPSETDLFVGTYEGTISYNGGDETIIDEDGRVTVAKAGNTYSFLFGSGIPDITGVKFREGDNNTHVSIGDGLEGITITASSLNILVVNSEGTWTADCSR